jgi:hypothetical protein
MYAAILLSLLVRLPPGEDVMEFLTALWLPIVVASIVLFIASAVAWMFMPHHRKDYAKLANEEKFITQVRELNVPVGRYMFPYCTHQEGNEPEIKRKFKDGPSGTITRLGNENMGDNIACKYVFFLDCHKFGVFA